MLSFNAIGSRQARSFFSLAALLCGALLSTPSLAKPPSVFKPEKVATFDAQSYETPESIAIDKAGNRYVSLALTGEIRKITPKGKQSTYAVLPLQPQLEGCSGPGGLPGALLGSLTFDEDDNLYASVNSCDPELRGVHRISPNGEVEVLATVPMNALLNGIAYNDGALYVADSELGQVWRVPADGSGPAEIWSDDALLGMDPDHVFPGPNGAQFHEGELYISNSDQGTILAIPLNCDGSAGPARVHAAGIPCDDFAFDAHDNIYCTTDPFNTVVRIAPNGSKVVVLDAADGLDNPTAAAFGHGVLGRHELYITNGSFPWFTTKFQPSLMRIPVLIPGAHHH